MAHKKTYRDNRGQRGRCIHRAGHEFSSSYSIPRPVTYNGSVKGQLAYRSFRLVEINVDIFGGGETKVGRDIIVSHSKLTQKFQP